jgi:membrane protein implicated in regulation of membrane protease activity
VRLWLKNNSLSLFFLVIFVATLLGQSFAGQHAFNEEQLQHGGEAISWARYVVSSSFGEAVLENWQSEYLQFTLFIVATVWLIQRGSNESKKPEDVGLESDSQQLIGQHAQRNSPLWAKVGGWRTTLYSNSLLLLMFFIFVASWFGQSLTAWNEYSDEQVQHGGSAVSWWEYLARPDFWEKTLQNWQSEFLAVGTMAVFTIYLRQRGSPESKPVGAPHSETASSG